MRRFVGMGATAFVAVALVAAPAPAEDEKMKMETTLTAGKLAKSPDKYYGKQVTVRGEVEDVLGSNMFTLDEDALLAGPDVLVLVPKALASTLKHDDKIVVSGEVRRYVEADLDRDFDFFESGKLVDVKTKVDWKTRPVIVAQSVQPQGTAKVTTGVTAPSVHSQHAMGTTAPATTTTTTTSVAAAGEVISAGKLAKDPGKYFGRTVTVRAEVEDVLGDNMFTLDEDALLAGPDVLVLAPAGVAPRLMKDQKIVVTGEVRSYVEADLDRDFDFFESGKLVDVKTKVDWKTRPVIVARTVRTE